MSDEEAHGFDSRLKELKENYHRLFSKLTREVGLIDKEFRQNPKAAKNFLKDYVAEYENDPAYKEQREMLAHYPGALPDLIRIDEVVNDLLSVIDRKAPVTFQKITRKFKAIEHSIDTFRPLIAQATALRPENWQMQRQEANLKRLSELLLELCAHKEIRVESSLDKRYGDDRWALAYKRDVAADQQNGNYYCIHGEDYFSDPEHDKLMEMLSMFTSKLGHCLGEKGKDKITERFSGMRHYGEHDSLRIDIENPPRAIRERFKFAQRMHLSHALTNPS